MIDILICTIDSGISNVESVLQNEMQGVKYVISHQITDDKFRLIPALFNSRVDLIISQIPGKGLSKNRNNALNHASGNIAVIADDDVRYLPGSFRYIEEVFKNDPELDVACFKIKTPEGQAEYKTYPVSSYLLNNSINHSVSSIEIAVRIKSIKGKEIFFDERFGIGNSFLIAGEENIFIHDCIKKGLKVVYFPIFIIEHSLDNSLRGFPPYHKIRARLSAAIDAYTNPFFAIPKTFGRTIKYMPEILHHKENPIVFLYYGLEAVFYIYFSEKKPKL